MKYLYALVMMQLKDKLDFSFVKSVKKLISKVVFSLLKFIIVAAISYGLFWVLSAFLYVNMRVPSNVMMLLYGMIFIMSLFSCTAGLMKTLYFADDNKVLITFPVNTNVLFLSRLIVYFIYELKRSLFLTIPIFIGYGLFVAMPWYYFIWLFFAFFFISALPVFAGALLSIPSMYVYTFVKKRRILLVAFYVALISAIVFAAIKLIGIIPESINLVEQLETIKKGMKTVLDFCDKFFYPVNLIIVMICGRFNGIEVNILTAELPINFGIIVGITALFAVGTFLISRPLFFSMMSKTIEFDKIPPKRTRKNASRSKLSTFFISEITALIRSREVGTFVVMYIVVPVMVYLMNKVFAAIDTNLSGVYMVYAFNLLIMILPMLAVDSVVATLYSREGRAAYVKKTMPLNPVLPLIMKLVPLFITSAISLAVSVVIFSSFVALSVWQIILICVSLIGLQWGHILWSGMTDLMNPKNEQYATTGDMTDNPNENFATISAFIISVIYALYAFILFPEGVMTACIKLCLIGVVFCAIMVYMFAQKIKVYYAEK